MEILKINLRTITQYLSNLRIVLKNQGLLVTLVKASNALLLYNALMQCENSFYATAL